MKGEVPKGLIVGILVVVALVALIGGGMFVKNVSGPTVQSGKPPADFYRHQ